MKETINQKQILQYVPSLSTRKLINEVSESQDPRIVLREYAKMTNSEMDNVLYNPSKARQIQLLRTTLRKIRRESSYSSGCKTNLTVKELARSTGMSISIIFDLLENDLGMDVTQDEIAKLSRPKIKKAQSKNIDLKSTRALGLEPKRIIKASRYQSKKPGGGPSQKIRFQKKNVPNQVVERANAGTTILFEKKTNPNTTQNITDNTSKETTWNLFIQAGAEYSLLPRLTEVYDRLLKIDFFGVSYINSWNLIKTLTQLSKGETVPVPIFNCLNLSWDTKVGEYPSVTISSRVEKSIVRYNRQNIIELQQLLKSIGNPQFYIIVPDSEMFDENVWRFSQKATDRYKISEELIWKLKELGFPDANVVKWSNYCRQFCSITPDEFTKKNYERIKNDTYLYQQVIRALPNFRVYLAKYIGEKNAGKIKENELLERALWYFSMYAGEGDALAESGALPLNFEEGTVPKWFQIGAQGKLSILTPTTNLYRYYDYKNKENIFPEVDFERFDLMVFSQENPRLSEEIKKRIDNATTFQPLVLYIPWGYRKNSRLGIKEFEALDQVDKLQAYLSYFGIPFKVLFVTTTPYWTEINQFDKQAVTNYFDAVRAEADTRGYETCDWDELRMVDLDTYLNLSKKLTDKEILKLLPEEDMKKAIQSAKKMGNRGDSDPFPYLRERMVEAEFIDKKFKPVKLSMAPSGGVNDTVDLDLPVLYPLLDELRYPWWPERRVKNNE